MATARGPFIGVESLTVPDTAVNFASRPEGSTAALVTVESADIRFWLDGTTPTASVGHVAASGDQIILDSPEEVRLFEAIRKGDDSATLRISYSKKSVN